MPPYGRIRLRSGDRGADHGLTIAEAAVAGADLAVLEDFKAFCGESGAKKTSETAVVQTAAAESNLGDACCAVSVKRSLDECAGDASVEASGDVRWGHAGAEISEEFVKHHVTSDRNPLPGLRSETRGTQSRSVRHFC